MLNRLSHLICLRVTAPAACACSVAASCSADAIPSDTWRGEGGEERKAAGARGVNSRDLSDYRLASSAACPETNVILLLLACLYPRTAAFPRATSRNVPHADENKSQRTVGSEKCERETRERQRQSQPPPTYQPEATKHGHTQNKGNKTRTFISHRAVCGVMTWRQAARSLKRSPAVTTPKASLRHFSCTLPTPPICAQKRTGRERRTQGGTQCTRQATIGRDKYR